MLTSLTIAEARDGLISKQFSAGELTAACLAEIEAASALNAFIVTTADTARAAAVSSDERRGRDAGAAAARALEGIPLGVKDLFCTKGVSSTACSHILDGFVPDYESHVTERLWANGAIMLGKLNMDEFAMGSSNETSYHGVVRNPWRGADGVDLVPGGSSGGSAAAVAGGLVLAATASDTGGSIRQPASFTGTVGLKPTYGRCSRWGMIAFASSLDQAGVITRDVRDAAIMLGVIAGHDPRDSTSTTHAVPDYEAAIDDFAGSLKGIRIGIPREYRVDNMPTDLEALWEQGAVWLRAAGAEIVDISLPHTRYALPTYYIIAPAEASSNLARYDGVRYGLRASGGDLIDAYERTRSEGFGDEVHRRVMIGTYVLSAGYYDAYYLKALKVRRLIAQDFEDAYQRCDFILTPTTPSAAFPLGAQGDDPIAMYLNDIFTVPVNLAGLPAISVPTGYDHNGLPLALQLIGTAFDEARLLGVAQILEIAAGVCARPTPWWKN